jgi:hypothetical protein
LTTPQPDEQGKTAPIELPGHQPPPSEAPSELRPSGVVVPPPAAPPPDDGSALVADSSPGVVIRAAPAGGQDVTYVPLVVTIGDGFKFGCGFFLAMVLAALIAFVLLAALFVLTGLLGVNLPLAR